MLREALAKVIAGTDLTRSEAQSLMTQMLGGELSPAQIGGLLTALSAKGEHPEELIGFASVMRDEAVRVDTTGDLLDTCGTGGSGLSTNNTSTMVAFVVAAAGVRVAKHGNRASSGRCGSMDLLERLGAPIELGPEVVARLIEEVGIGFMFAPLFHPGMKHVGPVRRQLGVRTCFNFLGPLANPARTSLQLLGVSDLSWAKTMANALGALGIRRAMVVHGSDGLDEVTLTGPTHAFVVDGGVRERTIHPEDFGLAPVAFDAIAGGEPADNERCFRDVLGGTCTDARRDHVALNAACALEVAGVADGFQRAMQILESGQAMELFETYRSKAVEWSR